MNLKLNVGSPTPLYHQIAEALRYRIATGQLSPGEHLPTVRKGAQLWSVNLHTVRRAYSELRREGLVESLGPRGTRIAASLPAAGISQSSAVASFVGRILRQAWENHGLSPADLVRLLRQPSLFTASLHRPRVHVVECSRNQSDDLATQLEEHYWIEALGWSLEETGAPPEGPIVATYFHFQEVRCRWPDRLAHTYFVAIRPDPRLSQRVIARSEAPKTVIRICESNPEMAHNISVDLAQLFPSDRFVLQPEVFRHPAEALTDSDPSPRLFAPRVWAALTAVQRSDPRATEVRYVFDSEDLERLAQAADWAPQAAPDRLQSGGLA